MAIEDNNPIGEIDPSVVQTDMSVPAEPVDIQVEGQEVPVMEEPKEDFYRNLAEDMDDRMLDKISYTLLNFYILNYHSLTILLICLTSTLHPVY